MSIDNLTLKQLKEIQNLFKGGSVESRINVDPTLGKYCIVRTCSAGVFAGIVKCRLGAKIVLEDSRRLWKWKAAQGISLSEVSQFGIDKSNSKICCVEPIKIIEDIEITVCSDISKKSIQDANIYQP